MSGTALDLGATKIAGSVLLQFTAEGKVRLYGAQIQGNLQCDDGDFKNPPQANVANSGMALDAEDIAVTGSVLLCSGFTAEGQVRLYGARIGGDLVCVEGEFINPPQANLYVSGMALDAEGVTVTGAVKFGELFIAEGTVRLYGARIAGNLDCQWATFERLDLTNASASAILDNKQSWPKAGNLRLDGFTYGRIAAGPASAQERLNWLGLQDSFARQPYRQLARVLRDAGDERGWRQVCAEMERKTWDRRKWYFRPASYLLRATIGFGYYSLRALWWLLGLVLIGSLWYALGYKTGSIVPTERAAYESVAGCRGRPAYYDAFHPVPYSLENSFPLVKLGVQDKWAPGQSAQCSPYGSRGRTTALLVAIASPQMLQRFRWFQICAGWLLATLFVAGVSGVIRKD